jgi:uncharacterized iron-regulated membrane protein
VLLRQLHGAAGIWALAVFVTVSISGVYLAFPQTMRAGIDLVLPARDLRAAASAVKIAPIAGVSAMPVDDAVALAQESTKTARVEIVGLPARPDQPYRIGLLRAGQARGAPPVTVFVDPWTRQIVETLDPQGYSLGEGIVAWQHVLHTGMGTGWVWKVLVFLVGFMPLLFSITGVSMWRLKRARREAARLPPDAASNPLSPSRRAAE